jgi:hypothetical protein
MAEYTHSFVFEAGVLKIIENDTGTLLLTQPSKPNFSGEITPWASESEALAWAEIHFSDIKKPIVDPSVPPNPLSPKPFPSWSASSSTNWVWTPPLKEPDPIPGYQWLWDESKINWLKVPAQPDNIEGHFWSWDTQTSAWISVQITTETGE